MLSSVSFESKKKPPVPSGVKIRILDPKNKTIGLCNAGDFFEKLEQFDLLYQRNLCSSKVNKNPIEVTLNQFILLLRHMLKK